MKRIFSNRNIRFEEKGLQDAVFLIGIFAFISVIIISLFPGKDTEIIIGKDFLVYAVMTVPFLAAIYFIIISFRRNLYNESPDFDSSIRNKLALALGFVAIVPSLLVVFASIAFINNTFSKLISDKTHRALQESVSMSEQTVLDYEKRIKNEIGSLDRMFREGALSAAGAEGRKRIRDMFTDREISVQFFRIERGGGIGKLNNLDSFSLAHIDEFNDFFSSISYGRPSRIDRVGIAGNDLIMGTLMAGGMLVAVYIKVPAHLRERTALLNSSLTEYQRHENLKRNFKSGSGVFLALLLTLIIIGISILVSVYLSKFITRPVLELVDAAKQLAFGNFNIELKRKSDDELALLFTAFDHMVRELDNNRKVMYQKQRLEAWREMARMLVHEIKNPLTPIRLSAERMRRRFIEGHPDTANIIISGTGTIIEEVQALMNILNAFTDFARLPEMKPEKCDLNGLVENCVSVFSGHEEIRFDIKKAEEDPQVVLDKILMRQTLINLIQNAIDAMNGKGKISIVTETVRGDYGRDSARVSVEDTGTGISPEEIKRIFEPGFTRKKTGSGLGLAIVDKIVMEHGGTVSCKSEPGKGSVFTIELPFNAIGEKNGQNSDS